MLKPKIVVHLEVFEIRIIEEQGLYFRVYKIKSLPRFLPVIFAILVLHLLNTVGWVGHGLGVWWHLNGVIW